MIFVSLEVTIVLILIAMFTLVAARIVTVRELAVSFVVGILLILLLRWAR